jgi:arylsulfatase A-like enzyme
VLLAVVTLAGACDRSDDAPARPRNVILISLDTLRADHLGCYGRGRNTSPAIDSLAAAGVRFADASSASPWTLPSHVTMLTGLYPSRHGVKDYVHQLPAERETLAEILAAHGFQSFAVLNTWSLAAPRFGLMQGLPAAHVRYVPEVERGLERRRVSVNSGREVVRAARELLRARDTERPFFLFLHFFDAHTDFTPRPEYRRRFVGPYHGPIDGTTSQLMALRRQGDRLSSADLTFLRELYDAEIRQLDDVLAGLFASVEEQGLLSDSLIVLTSDHGEEFQEHGGLLHGRTQYQELLAVPLILRGPGIPRGRVVAEPVSLVDLVPTILAVLGLPASGPFDGIDLSPSWSDPVRPLPERLLFGEADHGNLAPDGEPVIDSRRMARRGSVKLCSDRLARREELYDLARDPAERHDLSAQEPGRTAQLSAALDRHLAAQAPSQDNQTALSEADLELLRSLGYVEAPGDAQGQR